MKESRGKRRCGPPNELAPPTHTLTLHMLERQVGSAGGGQAGAKGHETPLGAEGFKQHSFVCRQRRQNPTRERRQNATRQSPREAAKAARGTRANKPPAHLVHMPTQPLLSRYLRAQAARGGAVRLSLPHGPAALSRPRPGKQSSKRASRQAGSGVPPQQQQPGSIGPLKSTLSPLLAPRQQGPAAHLHFLMCTRLRCRRTWPSGPTATSASRSSLSPTSQKNAIDAMSALNSADHWVGGNRRLRGRRGSGKGDGGITFPRT